jgi:hypothetical protein
MERLGVIGAGLICATAFGPRRGWRRATGAVASRRAPALAGRVAVAVRGLALFPADLNNDNQVDDADFVLFVAAYNELICP